MSVFLALHCKKAAHQGGFFVALCDDLTFCGARLFWFWVSFEAGAAP